MFELKRYLIVDDDAIFRLSLARYFAVQAEVSQAESLKDAEQKIETEKFDVVLLDKSLSDGSGLELVPKIRARLPHCVILMVSGDVNLAPIFQAIDLGIDDYVIKSENIVQDLMVRIPLATRRHADRAARAQSEHRASVELPKTIDEVSPEAFQEFQEGAEKEYLQRVLSLTEEDIGSVASLLGLARSTLHKKMSDYGVKRSYRVN